MLKVINGNMDLKYGLKHVQNWEASRGLAVVEASKWLPLASRKHLIVPRLIGTLEGVKNSQH